MEFTGPGIAAGPAPSPGRVSCCFLRCAWFLDEANDRRIQRAVPLSFPTVLLVVALPDRWAACSGVVPLLAGLTPPDSAGAVFRPDNHTSSGTLPARATR